MSTKKKYSLAIILITSLFFLWGFVHNLNPILIPHLKKACQLTNYQSSLVDSAFFVAYFVIALPAGLFMRRYGYKMGIVFGLLLFATGTLLFIPAANTRTFELFLAALFIIAAGLTFLESAANPYISVLGDPATATQRLNFAQSFNGLAATLAPFLGGQFILSGVSLTAAQEQAMSAGALDQYLQQEADAVKLPYAIISIVVLLVAFALFRTKLPEIDGTEDLSQEKKASKRPLYKEFNFMFGVAALFFYVGAQVGIVAFFIRFSEEVAGLTEKMAANFLAIALFGFMIGRFVGTFLMRYIQPSKLLAIFAFFSIIATVVAMNMQGMLAVYALMLVEFLKSIMFPTIFSLAIAGLGAKTKQASSILIMAIVGGAVSPPVMGWIIDMSSLQMAYSVPTSCFIVVFLFALFNLKNKTSATLSAAH
ncbi:L-fucose:H+ symporter permease [Sphingobacteriaceae bacterium WQ 2009]|uniref:L-fucose:H+ symporter permease n=1 Tax=Rhinopithecimicrobium faecis TaxID=2820698 RepID=A0A8T4HET5_9SPHI|nr:L-fucose:H+ symporter permease [Sphingobacteriaceae bacterium WQ 2009]